MSELTKIEWATHTWNPWEGCTKVSPGCAHCYAEARNQRFHAGANWGPGAPRRRTKNWSAPFKWNAACAKQDELISSSSGFSSNTRARVFTSLCDWLDPEVPIAWLADFLKLIHDTPNLDYLLLTKRPETWHKRIEEANYLLTQISQGAAHMAVKWLIGKEAPPNVWLGVSVEDQQRADERIPELLKIPANIRFLSVEPLLGPLDLESVGPNSRTAHLYDGRGRPGCNGKQVCNPLTGEAPYYREFDGEPCVAFRESLDWVIIGGESGPGARPCNVGWIQSLLAQCQLAGVPCFVKQLGDYCVTDNANCQDWPDEILIQGEGEGFAAGRVLLGKKGGDPSEWPEDLRVRKFPSMP
jgi:protein gp37